MDARFALIHFLCALAALVVAVMLSAPAGHPRARPWLCGAFFVLGVGELYVVALGIGLTMMWPVLHLLSVAWMLLPVLLWRHFGHSGTRAPRISPRLRQA